MSDNKQTSLTYEKAVSTIIDSLGLNEDRLKDGDAVTVYLEMEDINDLAEKITNISIEGSQIK